jgi:hypothetical protein
METYLQTFGFETVYKLRIRIPEFDIRNRNEAIQLRIGATR